MEIAKFIYEWASALWSVAHLLSSFCRGVNDRKNMFLLKLTVSMSISSWELIYCLRMRSACLAEQKCTWSWRLIYCFIMLISNWANEQMLMSAHLLVSEYSFPTEIMSSCCWELILSQRTFNFACIFSLFFLLSTDEIGKYQCSVIGFLICIFCFSFAHYSHFVAHFAHFVCTFCICQPEMRPVVHVGVGTFGSVKPEF